MPKDTWLVVANGSVARIFKVHKKQSLIEIETLVHPESRLHNRDLSSDKPGRAFESSGPTRHAIEPTTTPKQQAFINFSRNISNYLEESYSKDLFERLYIVANPTILGLLRQAFSPNVSKLIKEEVNKDITHMQSDEIINHLPFLL